MPRTRKPQVRELPRGYGWVSPLPDRDGLARVEARWREDGKSRGRRFTAATHQEAHDAAIDFLISQHRARRDRRPVLDTDLTVTDVVDLYIARHRSGWHGGTEYVYSAWARYWIYPSIGPTRLIALTRNQVQTWIDDLARTLAPATVRNAMTLLRSALNHAVDMELIASNPAKGVKAPQARREPRQVWSAEDVGIVLAHVRDDPFMAAYYAVALMTGARPGELRALQWGDVDTGRGLLHIRRTATLGTTGADVTGTRTKTGDPRTVALVPVVVAALEAWRVAQAGILRGSAARPLRPFVFSPHADGRMVTDYVIRNRHDRVIRETGVPSITLHGTRHVFATLAMESGAHPLVVSQVLGHRGVAITLDTYSHPSTAMQRSSLDALQAAILPAGEAEKDAK